MVIKKIVKVQRHAVSLLLRSSIVIPLFVLALSPMRAEAQGVGFLGQAPCGVIYKNVTAYGTGYSWGPLAFPAVIAGWLDAMDDASKRATFLCPKGCSAVGSEILGVKHPGDSCWPSTEEVIARLPTGEIDKEKSEENAKKYAENIPPTIPNLVRFDRAHRSRGSLSSFEFFEAFDHFYATGEPHPIYRANGVTVECGFKIRIRCVPETPDNTPGGSTPNTTGGSTPRSPESREPGIYPGPSGRSTPRPPESRPWSGGATKR